jgi:ornithine decarboxylase
MTNRITEFIKENPTDSPLLVVDLDIVLDNYLSFRRAMPESLIYYAVKANPAPALLEALADQGSSFDCASIAEIDMAIAAGAPPNRISYGNTIKKERDIATAYGRGIRMFAVDSFEEVAKVGRAAPLSKVFCRILCAGEGAEWPLSRKFGCEPEMATAVLCAAAAEGLTPYGVSFHVGSQQTNTDAWDSALASASCIFKECAGLGIHLEMVNLGGGFPTAYLKEVPGVHSYGSAINAALRRHFPDRLPETIIEPGRGMVGNAGVIRAEVVLISKKSTIDDTRWVYLDIGKFGGLAETINESIRYDIRVTNGDRSPNDSSPCIIAGPSCDSVDVLYELLPYPLPNDLSVGDEILIFGTGAYTTTYASVAFNGFPPLACRILAPSLRQNRMAA